MVNLYSGVPKPQQEDLRQLSSASVLPSPCPVRNTESLQFLGSNLSTVCSSHQSNTLSIPELISPILHEFSANNSTLTPEEFSTFIMKYQWSLTVFVNAFREDIWSCQYYSHLRVNNSISCVGSKFLIVPLQSDVFMSSLYLLVERDLMKALGVIHESVLIIMEYSRKQTIRETVMLENCYIKEESKFSIFVINIYQCSQNEPRLSLAFRSEAKKNRWLAGIIEAGKIRRFKDFYIIERKLGTGKFSEVFTVIQKVNYNRYIVKIIAKRKVGRTEREMMKNEISILKLLSHPNIVKLVDVFDSQKYLMLILEHLNGKELFQSIKGSAKTEQKIQMIIFQLLKALEYMNSRGVVHRDIKSENVILVGDPERPVVKLIDFGLAAYAYSESVLSLSCGTLGYSAPEVLKKCGYGSQIDMWSLGVVAYTLFTDHLPFYDSEKKAMIQKTLKIEIDFDEPAWTEFSEEAKEFVRGLLTREPRNRLTPEQALGHIWIRKNLGG